MSNPLILVPTEGEKISIARHLDNRGKGQTLPIELCGFGQIAAAARCSQLLSRMSPSHVYLVGIAGSLNSELTPGTATTFAQVQCEGIGVGFGDTYQSASTLGWKQWPPQNIEDSIALVTLQEAAQKSLLSVCAASADSQEANFRRDCYPEATAEDMEGFGVALACRLWQRPLTIIRGISNVAGIRKKGEWRIEAALDSAAKLLHDHLQDARNSEGASEAP